MDSKLQSNLFDREDILTIEDFKSKANGTLIEENNIAKWLTIPPIIREEQTYEWVFQFDDEEPTPFYRTFQNMLNDDGKLVITCTPSNVTHLEFKQENRTFKIYSRTIN